MQIHIWHISRKSTSSNTLSNLAIRHYIDDIFILWTSTTEHLKVFESYLNQIHPTVKFTLETLVKQVNYLDAQVHLEQQIICETFLQDH